MIIHPDYVGIDISKAHLDIFDASRGRQQRCANTAKDIASLIRSWKRQPPFILFEATGHYDAALAGLAPFNVDSGQCRGLRRISGGRKRVRDALYMAAVAASRSKSRFATFYKTLRNAGKPPKLAFIALARKILTTLNAILRDQIAFQP